MNSRSLKQFDDYSDDPAKLRLKLEEYIRSFGIIPDEHYIDILEFIYKTYEHPTAKIIYRTLNPVKPKLSRTMVNTILEIMSRAGVIRMLPLDKHNNIYFDCYYDWDTEPHAHFICASCGDIHNMPFIGDMTTNVVAPQGAFIYNMQVASLGICGKCRSSFPDDIY